MLVYLDGEYVPHAEARVSVDDRGFLFADGVYEVVRVYDGRILLLEAHLQRMAEGLRALRISFEDMETLAGVAKHLLERNVLQEEDATIYFQITRGTAPRTHAFPQDASPTVYIATRTVRPHPDSFYTEGVGAITVPDIRWTRCDIKSVSLLPNVLANQQASEAGAFEALFVRDGIVVEGSHSNLFAVYDGTLVTYPASNYILAGITRQTVLELAPELRIPIRKGPIPFDRLADADELFLSGTTTKIMPVVRVDGAPVADERPGPVTRRIQRAYGEAVSSGDV